MNKNSKIIDFKKEAEKKKLEERIARMMAILEHADSLEL